MRHIMIALALALLAGLMPSARADDAAAVRRLAEQGDAAAQFALGSLYRYGQGVAQDDGEALRWWRKAADLGLTDAQFALGEFHAGGSGIAPDRIRAYMWFDITASQTGEDWLQAIAGSNRDALAARMSLAEIREAQRQAADWKAEHGK